MRKSMKERQKEIEGMACSTFALDGNPNTARQTHSSYEEMCHSLGYGQATGQFVSPNPQTTTGLREQYMMNIERMLHTGDIVVTRTQLYLCGGFSGGALVPEHMWLEDRVANRTYDRFINTTSVLKTRKAVGAPGQSFRPGCEESAFTAFDIVRIKIDGYTEGQITSIRALRKDLGFE